MCDKNQISSLLKNVVEEAKDKIGVKLDSVILYGSYARGDFDDESDVDILFKLKCDPEEIESYEGIISDICSRLSLDYDVMVSIHAVSLNIFNRFKKALPFYANIEKDGVRVA